MPIEVGVAKQRKEGSLVETAFANRKQISNEASEDTIR